MNRERKMGGRVGRLGGDTKSLPSFGAYTGSRHNGARLSQISDPINRK
jgi:hypothetical protein